MGTLPLFDGTRYPCARVGARFLHASTWGPTSAECSISSASARVHAEAAAARVVRRDAASRLRMLFDRLDAEKLNTQ